MFAVDIRLGQTASKLDTGLEFKAGLTSREKRMRDGDLQLGSAWKRRNIS